MPGVSLESEDGAGVRGKNQKTIKEVHERSGASSFTFAQTRRLQAGPGF